jgi:hypothetical protein
MIGAGTRRASLSARSIAAMTASHAAIDGCGVTVHAQLPAISAVQMASS